MTRIAPRLAAVIGGLVLPAAIIALWWGFTAHSRNPFWPPLSKIVARFREDWLFKLVPTELVPSLVRLAEGFSIGVVLALVIGVALGLLPTFRVALAPIMDFARSVPNAALIPAAFFLFGIGDWSKSSMVAWATFWPVVLNTIDGVRGIDQNLHDVASVYKLRRRDKLLLVVFPAAAPQIIAGLRVGLTLALLALVVTEIFIATSGIGYFIGVSQTRYDIVSMWTGIFVLMILAYCLNALFNVLEARALEWHRAPRTAGRGAEMRETMPTVTTAGQGSNV